MNDQTAIAEVELNKPHATELSPRIDIVYPETVEGCHQMITAMANERLNFINAMTHMQATLNLMSGCLGNIICGSCDEIEILKTTGSMKQIIDAMSDNIEQIK